MRVLITGATGFLGSRTTQEFAKNPRYTHILATGRTLSPERRVMADHVTYLLGELTDEAFVSRLFQQPVDLVINCASLSSPWGKYEDFYQANVVSQQILIAQSVLSSVKRFIYISSPSVYFRFRDQLDVTENTVFPPKMVNDYARTKLEAERLLERSSLSYVTLRPRALIGAGDTVIMPRLIRSYESGKLKIMGSGENQVDLTPVANMVDAIILAAEASQIHSNQAYNISNGQPVNLWQAINDILQMIGHEPVKKRIPYWLLMTIAWFMEITARHLTRDQEPTLTRYSVGVLAHSFTLNIDKATKNLGYVPRQTVEEAMKEFADWYQIQLE
ncbi:MAG: NAD-dependent epimerase/dehydratase family protein [Marinoscillum sp.]